MNARTDADSGYQSEPELITSSSLANLADRQGALDVERIVVGSLVFFKFNGAGSLELSGRVVAVKSTKVVVYHNSPRDGDSKGLQLVLPMCKVLAWEEPIPDVVSNNLKVQTSHFSLAAQKGAITGDTVIVESDMGVLIPVTIVDIRRSTQAEHYGLMKVIDEDEEVVCWVDNILTRRPRSPYKPPEPVTPVKRECTEAREAPDAPKAKRGPAASQSEEE